MKNENKEPNRSKKLFKVDLTFPKFWQISPANNCIGEKDKSHKIKTEFTAVIA